MAAPFIDDNASGRPIKGREGDALHTMRCAAGFTVRWWLRAIARSGVLSKPRCKQAGNHCETRRLAPTVRGTFPVVAPMTATQRVRPVVTPGRTDAATKQSLAEATQIARVSGGRNPAAIAFRRCLRRRRDDRSPLDSRRRRMLLAMVCLPSWNLRRSTSACSSRGSQMTARNETTTSTACCPPCSTRPRPGPLCQTRDPPGNPDDGLGALDPFPGQR